MSCVNILVTLILSVSNRIFPTEHDAAMLMVIATSLVEGISCVSFKAVSLNTSSTFAEVCPLCEGLKNSPANLVFPLQLPELLIIFQLLYKMFLPECKEISAAKN